MRAITITAILSVALVAALTPASEARTEALQQAIIVHMPIPLGAKGKPLPIMAGIKETGAEVKSIKVSIKSSEDMKSSKITMNSMGRGMYQAIIPAKTTALSSKLIYRIEAETSLGAKSNTPWYPVKLESLEDKVKDASESAEKQKPKKPRRIRKFIKQHPVAAGVGTAVVVGGSVAVASGGGGSSSSDSSGGSYPGGDPAAGSGTPESGTANIAGTWHYTNPMPGETISGTMHLSQSGTSVSGNFSEEGDGGSVSGSANGNSISLTLNFGGGVTDHLSGTVNGNQMSGSWHENDTGESGTFTATR